jgi:hypothetical protein
MKIAVGVLLSVLTVCGASCGADGKPKDRILVFKGASDASAGVALTQDLIIVADDENNILRVYKADGGSPVFSYDTSEFLGVESEHPEADIEGAAKIGDQIYWITSHGRNKDGKLRPSRYRFFATEVKVRDGKVAVRLVGKPCTTLVQQMVRARSMGGLGLEEAARLGVNLKKSERERLAPKEEGFNIEGLCASVDGKTLYIGLRNPRPLDRTRRRMMAIVARLDNAQAVIEKGIQPVFGEPMLWDLDGMGVRSMEYSTFHKAYFVVSGAHDGTPKFALYRWSGNAGDQPTLVRKLSLSDFGPEALVPFDGSGKLLLLSDDGTLNIKVAGPSECMPGELNKDGTCPNKYLMDPSRKTFRGIRLEP